jgi:hypothetical protein
MLKIFAMSEVPNQMVPSRLRKFPEENDLAVPGIEIAPCITPQQGSNILSCHSRRCKGGLKHFPGESCDFERHAGREICPEEMFNGR